jgi:hypothetical protein
VHYRARNRNAEHWFYTVNGKVSQACREQVWLVGRRIEDALKWTASCNYRVYVSERAGAPEQRVDLGGALDG